MNLWIRIVEWLLTLKFYITNIAMINRGQVWWFKLWKIGMFPISTMYPLFMDCEVSPTKESLTIKITRVWSFINFHVKPNYSWSWSCVMVELVFWLSWSHDNWKRGIDNSSCLSCSNNSSSSLDPCFGFHLESGFTSSLWPPQIQWNKRYQNWLREGSEGNSEGIIQ